MEVYKIVSEDGGQLVSLTYQPRSTLLCDTHLVEAE
jgi:hypothetical protein